MNWSKEDIALMKKLWSQGTTARMIADILGKGITRNAVIGKVHRMKLASRISPPVEERGKAGDASKKQKTSPQSKEKENSEQSNVQSAIDRSKRGHDVKKPKVPQIVGSQSVESSAASDADAEVGEDDSLLGSLFGGDGCKWPFGHPNEEEFHFCGQQRYQGLPYCEEHVKEAYQPIDRKRGGATRGS